MSELCPACGQPLAAGERGDFFCVDQEYRYFLKVPLTSDVEASSSTLSKEGVCLFLMLNPGSTNNNRKRHPTRENCERFAREWGYGELWTCNLFALRSPNPRALRRHDDPIGPDNDAHIRAAAKKAKTIVCAWGNRGGYMGRAQEVVSILRKADADAKLYTLGELTKQGQPRHPLFVPAHTQRRPFHGVGLAGKAAARGRHCVQ